jgi:hypothetical protein
MSKDIRYLEPNTLVEVTTVTIGNSFLMRPSDEANEIIAGVFGKAQREHAMPVCDLKVMSSHYHGLFIPRDAGHLAEFMNFVNTNLSKELGRLYGITGPKLQSYHMIPVSNEEEAQVARLRYLISNSVKEHLVERPEQWPGIHGVTVPPESSRLTGRWYDRTREHAELQRTGEVDAAAFATEERIVLSRLPCWRHLSEEEHDHRVAELVEQVVEVAAAERRRTGQKVLGVKKILKIAPLCRPATVETSRKPRFHTFCKSVYRQMWEAYSWVLAAFRDAADRLRGGERNVVFPEGTHPPSLPFVPFACRGPG